MPNTTTNTYKNYYGKKKRRRRRRTRLDGKIAKVAKQVINEHEKKVVEMKSYEVEVGGSAIDSSGIIQSLSSIIQGDAYNQRIGDRIVPKGLSMRLYLQASSTTNTTMVRAIIFKALEPGTPTVAQILSLTTAGADRPLSQLNLDSKGLFRILYDNTYLVAKETNSNIPYLQVDKFYIKLNGVLQYDAGTTDNLKGNIYMLLLSNQAVNTPQISLISRLKYTDQ